MPFLEKSMALLLVNMVVNMVLGSSALTTFVPTQFGLSAESTQSSSPTTSDVVDTLPSVTTSTTSTTTTSEEPNTIRVTSVSQLGKGSLSDFVLSLDYKRPTVIKYFFELEEEVITKGNLIHLEVKSNVVHKFMF